MILAVAVAVAVADVVVVDKVSQFVVKCSNCQPIVLACVVIVIVINISDVMVCNAMIKIQISIFVDQPKIRGHTVYAR